MQKLMKRYAIIVAGGSGSRFGGPVPKQFQELAGRPVLMHTIDKFALHPSQPSTVVVVLPERLREYWQGLCRQYRYATAHRVVAGGDSRFESVKNALERMSFSTGDLVAVHDGVRPMASHALIGRVFEQAALAGAAIPVVPVTDSVRHVADDGRSMPLLRDTLRAVQTPQAFDAIRLQRGYDVPYDSGYTDDASVWEHSGGKVTLVEGETTNIKITHPLDMLVAEYLLKR